MKRKRRPSLRQVFRCETAIGSKRCQCRCQGKLHGANRGNSDDFFHSLPSDDPHFIYKAIQLRFAFQAEGE